MKSSLIFLSGVAVGTVLGLLIAPEPGSATLQKIKREADRFVDKVVEKKSVAEEAAETVSS
jgi:gas vesicle protein